MFFAARRQEVSGTGNSQFGNVTVNNPGGFSIEGGNFNIELGFTNPLQGGNFIGPIAFNTVEKTISSGKLTMATILETPTSYVIVNGEGGNADDLTYIISKNNVLVDLGAIYSGQLLFLQAGDANITLKHNTGNIFIPSGSDLTLNKYDSSANTGGAYAILMWDDQNIGASSGRWVLVSSGASTSGTWVGTATSDLDMADNDIDNVAELEFNNSSTPTSSKMAISALSSSLYYNVPSNDSHFFSLGGDIKFEVNDDIDVRRNDMRNIQRVIFDEDDDTFIAGEHYGSIADDVLEIRTGDSLRVKIDNSTTTFTSETQIWNDVKLGLQASDEVDFVAHIKGGTFNNLPLGTLSMEGGGVFKSYDSTEIGYQVTNSSFIIGSEGTIQNPYKESTTSHSTGNNTTLDGYFGAADGCIGIQYNSSESAGGGKYRLWIRANGGWYRTEAY